MPKAIPSLDELAAMVGKVFRITRIRATLGDLSGNVYDPDRPGYVWVTRQDDEGVHFQEMVRASKTMPMLVGMAVLLGYDSDGELEIAEADFQGMLAALLNPIMANPLNRDVYQYITQDRIQTLVSYAVGTAAVDSLSVVVRPWFYRDANGVWALVREQLVDLSSYVPAAGNHRLAAIWKTPYSTTLAVTASTAQNVANPLDETDVQQCQNGISIQATPIWFYRLYGGQTSIREGDSWRDGRQFINIATEPVAGKQGPPGADGVEDEDMRQLKRLVGPVAVATGPATIYTAPTFSPSGLMSEIRFIHVQNPSGAAVTFTLSIGTDAAGKRLYDAYSIPAAAAGVTGNVLDISCLYALASGEILQAAAGANNVLVITVSGYEGV